MWPYLPTFSNGSFRSFYSLCQWTSCFIMWISSMLIDQAAEFPEKTKTFFCVSIIDYCLTLLECRDLSCVNFRYLFTIAWSTLPRMILLFSEMHHLAGVSISIIPSILHLFFLFLAGLERVSFVCPLHLHIWNSFETWVVVVLSRSLSRVSEEEEKRSRPLPSPIGFVCNLPHPFSL